MNKVVCIIEKTWYWLTDWLIALFPLIRVIVPLVMAVVMFWQVENIYIPCLDLSISAIAMKCITVALHVFSVMFGIKAVSDRGASYDIAGSFIATETVLFIYFMQHQFISALSLLLVLLVGLIAVLIYGKKCILNLYYIGFLPRRILVEIAKAETKNGKAFSIMRIAVHRYLIIATALLFLIPSVSVLAVYDTKIGNKHAVIDDTQKNQMILNIETIRLLDNSTWYDLDKSGKLDALQVIADIETYYLGIKPVSVVDCKLSSKNLGDIYIPERRIDIDLDKHENTVPLTCVNVILHECRHMYQFERVASLGWNESDILNGLYYAPVMEWRDEFFNYIHSDDDMDGYYNQEIERDARQYAKEVTEVYKKYIDFGELPVR